MEAIPASPIAVSKEIPSLRSTTRKKKEEEPGCDDEPAQFRRVCLKRPTIAPPASPDDINGMSTIAKPDEDPFNRTISSSQREICPQRMSPFPKTFPKGWYCHDCGYGPLLLTRDLRCINVRQDKRICGHERCYFCTPHYEVLE